MIPQGAQVFVVLDPVDLRCSFDRLSGIAQEHIGYEARSSALFVFYGRRRDALKVLFFDSSCTSPPLAEPSRVAAHPNPPPPYPTVDGVAMAMRLAMPDGYVEKRVRAGRTLSLRQRRR